MTPQPETCSTLVSLRSLCAESHEANGAPDEASAAEPAQSGTSRHCYLLSDQLTKWSSCLHIVFCLLELNVIVLLISACDCGGG